MDWLLSQSIEVKIAILGALITALTLIVGVLQYYKSDKSSNSVKQSVTGKNHRVVQIGGKSKGNIDIK